MDTLLSQCPPLGLTPDLAPDDDSATLAPGDGFLLFTDGFYDMVDSGGERMDIAAFEQRVRGVAAGDARELSDGVLDGLRAFSGGAAFADDLAAVAAFRRAAG